MASREPHTEILAVRQPRFGRSLRRARQSRGLTQRALAGEQLTASYISLLECGQRVPSLGVAIALAQTLEVPLEELLGADTSAVLADVTVQEGRLLPQVNAYTAIDIGDYEHARQVLSDALTAAVRDGDQDQLLRIGLNLQEILRLTLAYDERLALLERLLALELVVRSSHLTLSLTVSLCAALRDSGRLNEALEGLTRAKETADAMIAVPVVERVRLLAVLVSVLSERDEPERLRPAIAELLELGGTAGQPGIAGRARWAAGMALAKLDEREAAHACLRAAVDELPFAAMPVRDWLRFYRAGVSALLDMGCDLPLAATWLRAAEAAAETANLAPERLLLRALSARYELLTGNPAGALDRYAEISVSSLSLPPLAQARLLTERADALRQLGRLSEAAEALRHAAAQCEQAGSYQLASELWRKVDEVGGQIRDQPSAAAEAKPS